MEDYRNKLLTTLLTGTLMWAVTMNAQTDYTSRITNPSFETGNMTGWTATNMSMMDNNGLSPKKSSTTCRAVVLKQRRRREFT